MDVEVSVVKSSRRTLKSTIHYWWYKLKLKSVMQHVGLLVALMGYTLFGGLVSLKVLPEVSLYYYYYYYCFNKYYVRSS